MASSAQGDKLWFPTVLTLWPTWAQTSHCHLFSKGIISKSEFPKRGRGQMTRLKHLLQQISLCHDLLGPVHLTAVAIGGKEKETTAMAGEGSVSPPSVGVS